MNQQRKPPRPPRADGESSRLVAAALDGVRVLDFTANAAGPSCTQMLADFGADVIKVEPPTGDSTRGWGGARYGPSGEFTPDFLSFNRNKRGVCVNLKEPSGLARILELVRGADVVVESFKPGVTTRLGISPEDLRRVRADLIYCSVSGFGQHGPLRAQPAYDMLMQAFTGHMSITGEPGRPSVRIGPSAIDLTAGALAAFGVMVALRHRDRTGEGQDVQTSLFDAAMYLISNHIAHYSATGETPQKFGSQLPLIAPYGVFQASDREFYIGVASDRMWERFCERISRPDLATDHRFASNQLRVRNLGALLDVLVPIFRREPASHWLRLTAELEIPGSAVQTVAEVVAHPHTAARGLLVETDVDDINVVGSPLELTRTPPQVRRHAPRLGEDDQLLESATPWRGDALAHEHRTDVGARSTSTS